MRLCRPQPNKPAARPDLLAARRAAEQWGVLSLDELRACGLSRDAVAVRVANGRLHPMHRAVYAVGHANPPLEGRWLAAVKAHGRGAVLSHFSASGLWGLTRWDDRHPEVTVVASGSRPHPRIRMHRTAAFDACDVVQNQGIPVTSPARTLADLAAALDYPALRRCVREAQSLRLVNLRRLAEVVDRLGPRRGVSKLVAILASSPAPTRSDLEDVVLDLLLRHGLAPPDVNVPLVLAGRRVIPDFRWPAERLVVEADGAAWHDNKLAREDDAERQALLEAHGDRVLRVTWKQAIESPQQTLSRLQAAGAPLARSA